MPFLDPQFFLSPPSQKADDAAAEMAAAFSAPLETYLASLLDQHQYGIFNLFLSPIEHSPFKLHYIRKPKSVHERFDNPWLGTEEFWPIAGLQQSGRDLTKVFHQFFFHLPTPQDSLRNVGDITEPVVAISLSPFNFSLPLNMDSGPVIASILATLHTLLVDGRDPAILSTWAKPTGYITIPDPDGLGGSSFACPGSDTQDRYRYYKAGCFFGEQLITRFPDITFYSKG